jgi:hypothetical protein
MAEDLVKPWIEVSSAIDSIRSSLSAAFKEQAGFERGTGELAKATEKLRQASMVLGNSLTLTNSITKEQARDFYATARAVRVAASAAKEMELKYKGMQLAAMSLTDMAGAAADKIAGLGNSIKKLAGIGIAGGVGLKTLTDANLAFKRSLFESDRIASRYGESLGSLKSAFKTIRSETEMSQQDFSNLNKSIKELYLGIPPTAQAIAKMVQELRGRVGYSDDVITKTLESLVGLQSKVPQIVESVSAAWAAAAKGQGDAANKMALQMRLLLSQSGATRGEIEKVMAAMEPRSSADRSPFLNFEQQMAKAEQRSKDAQVTLALKLEPTLRTINTALSKLADILSGVNGTVANGVAGFVALAGGAAVAVKSISAVSNAYKILGAASKIGLARAGLGGVGATAAGGFAAGAGGKAAGLAGRLGGPLLQSSIYGYSEYHSRRNAGATPGTAGMHAGGRFAASMAGGLAGAKLGGAAGSVFGPVGTLVGGAIGGIGGSWAGSSAYKTAMGTPGGHKKDKNTEDEDLMRKVDMANRSRKEQTELLAAQAGLFSSNYAGGAKEVRKLLQTEEGILKVRDLSLAKQAEGKTLAERIVYAEGELRKGLISRSEAIDMIAGKERDVAKATKEVERISKSLVTVDRQRLEHSHQIMAAMEMQIAVFDKLSEAGNSVVDGLAQTISKLQGEGLFRDGFGESFNNAIKVQEANVEISAKKMQAVLFRNLAGRGEIKDLDVFINLKDDKIREQVETARKGLKESISKEDSLTLQLSEKQDKVPRTDMSSEKGKALLSEIEGLKAQLDAATEASDGFNKTLMGLANVLPDVSGLDEKLTSLTANLQKMKDAGDFGVDYQATINQIKEITAAKEANLIATSKLADVRLQGSEASEKAMLANNERSIQLSKQRISLAENMNMGMARTWKYTKETVALQERQLQLLTQQSERYGQDMQAAAGPELKLDLNFADSDYEGFLADIKRRSIEIYGIGEKQETIVNNITKAANKRLEVEGKILQTSDEIMQTTKQMREGWLEAVQGSMMGFGDMEKIIGTQDKSATQLLRYGAPATYKYGGLMDHRPTELTRPPEYSDIYGAFRNRDKNANPFPQTHLEGSTGVRDIPYDQYGYKDITDIKRQAQVASRQGGMLMTMGTQEQDFGMQGIQQASINTATSLNGIPQAANLVRDALTEMAGMIHQAGSTPAARAPGQLVSVPWVQGVQSSNNWGAEGTGTAQGVSQGTSYLPLPQTSIPSGGVDRGTHKRGGTVKGYSYGGSLEAGSYIVSEGPTRANADVLSQIPGVTFAARGGGIGETRAGHDSIYYDVAGYGTGGAVLMPNEAIIPPAFAHLGPSLNHYARGGLEIHAPRVGDIFPGNTPEGWEGSGGRAWKIKRGGATRPTGTAKPQWAQNPNSQWNYRPINPNPNGPNPNMRFANRGANIGLDGKPIDMQPLGRQLKSGTGSANPAVSSSAIGPSKLAQAHKGGKGVVRGTLGKAFIGTASAIEGVDRLAAGENWGGTIGGAAGAGVFMAGSLYATGALATGIGTAVGVAGLLPFLAAAGLIAGANWAVKKGTGVDVLGSTYNALTGTGASYGRDTFNLEASAGTASKASYVSGFIHSLPGAIWESTKDLVNPSRMVDISEAYEKTWAKDRAAVAQPNANMPITDGSDLPGIRSIDDFREAIKNEEWAFGRDGGPGLIDRIHQADDPEHQRIKAQNELRAKELRDYKTEMAVIVTDGKRYKYQQELKAYKEANPARWENLVKKHNGNEDLTEAAYAQRKINEVKKRALEKGKTKDAITTARENLSLGIFSGPFVSKDPWGEFGEGRTLKVPEPPNWMSSAQDQTHLTSLYAENKIPDVADPYNFAKAQVKEMSRLAAIGQEVRPSASPMPSAAQIESKTQGMTPAQKNELRLKAYQASQPSISGVEVKHIGGYGKAVGQGLVGQDSKAFYGAHVRARPIGNANQGSIWTTEIPRSAWAVDMPYENVRQQALSVYGNRPREDMQRQLETNPLMNYVPTSGTRITGGKKVPVNEEVSVGGKQIRGTDMGHIFAGTMVGSPAQQAASRAAADQAVQQAKAQQAAAKQVQAAMPVAATAPVTTPPSTAPVQATSPEQKLARGGFVGGYRPPKRFALGGWAGNSRPNSGRGSLGRRSSEKMNAHISNNGLSAPKSLPFQSQMNDGPMGGGNFNKWSGSVKPANMRGSFGGLSGSMKERSESRMNSQLNATAKAGYQVGTRAISTAPQKNTPAGFDGPARVVTVKLDTTNDLKDLAVQERAQSSSWSRENIN